MLQAVDDMCYQPVSADGVWTQSLSLDLRKWEGEGENNGFYIFTHFEKKKYVNIFHD